MAILLEGHEERCLGRTFLEPKQILNVDIGHCIFLRRSNWNGFANENEYFINIKQSVSKKEKKILTSLKGKETRVAAVY